MKRVFAVVAALLGTFNAASVAQAVADIGLMPTSPYAVRVLPGSSGSVSFTVTNYGPDAVAPRLTTSSIYLLLSGYTLTMAEPACGALTGAPDLYAIALPTLEAGASATCTLDVARDTSPYAASDLPLDWFVDATNDPDLTNDFVGFAIGSLIDLSVEIVPISFEIDDTGIAHAIDRLVVTSHGPTAVEPFLIGACTDHGWPGFHIDADFEGGCGSYDYSPGCFDSGFGFAMPAMASGDTYSCTIGLTGTAVYDQPVVFDLSTALLMNPDTYGGSLLDMNPDDNHAGLALEPVSDAIFATGFDG
jgi:hypothetical protein